MPCKHEVVGSSPTGSTMIKEVLDMEQKEVFEYLYLVFIRTQRDALNNLPGTYHKS